MPVLRNSVVGLAAAVGAVVPVLPASAQAPGPVWHRQAVPATSTILSTAVRLDAHTTWAAGFKVSRNGGLTGFTPVLIAKDDRKSGWVRLPAPTADLNGGRVSAVAGTSTRDAWIFGDRQPNSTGYLAAHWNGSRWTNTRIPTDATAQYGSLLGADARTPGDTWVVGTQQRTDPTTHNGYSSGLLDHWDGHAWHRAILPFVSDTWWLNSVKAVSAKDVWAVGNTAGASDLPVLLHFDGRSWHRVAAPKLPGLYGEYQSVTASGPNDVWAVGRVITTPKDHGHPLAAHFDGHTWRNVTLPNIGPGLLWSVAAVPGGGVAAVGWGPDALGYDQPLGLRYRGGRWERLNLAQPGLPNASFESVLADPKGRLTALGSGETAADPNTPVPLLLTSTG